MNKFLKNLRNNLSKYWIIALIFIFFILIIIIVFDIFVFKNFGSINNISFDKPSGSTILINKKDLQNVIQFLDDRRTATDKILK